MKKTEGKKDWYSKLSFFGDVIVYYIYGTVYAAVAAVNAKIVVFGNAPLSVSVEVVVILPALILGENYAFGFGRVYSVNADCPFLAELQVGVDKDGYQIYHIAQHIVGAAADYNAGSLACHPSDHIGLGKVDIVLHR